MFQKKKILSVVVYWVCHRNLINLLQKKREGGGKEKKKTQNTDEMRPERKKNEISLSPDARFFFPPLSSIVRHSIHHLGAAMHPHPGCEEV